MGTTVHFSTNCVRYNGIATDWRWNVVRLTHHSSVRDTDSVVYCIGIWSLHRRAKASCTDKWSIFVFSMHVESHVGLVTKLGGRTEEEYKDDTGGRCSAWIVAPFGCCIMGLGACARSGRARRSLSVRTFRSLRRARRSVVLGLTGLEIVVESWIPTDIVPNVLSVVIISVDEVVERRHAEVEDAWVRRGERGTFENSNDGSVGVAFMAFKDVETSDVVSSASANFWGFSVMVIGEPLIDWLCACVLASFPGFNGAGVRPWSNLGRFMHRGLFSG
ncbi:hypothetical protein EDD16DRAFT_768563 [Pisolithus croceorrhizus]|nr:hypothetical protein EDD16DRAFT_768563 [Pisolithus croceorrhizus]